MEDRVTLPIFTAILLTYLAPQAFLADAHQFWNGVVWGSAYTVFGTLFMWVVRRDEAGRSLPVLVSVPLFMAFALPALVVLLGQPLAAIISLADAFTGNHEYANQWPEFVGVFTPILAALILRYTRTDIVRVVHKLRGYLGFKQKTPVS